MAKRKQRARAVSQPRELDSVYILKLVLYMIIGSQWLYILYPDKGQQFPIPIGLVIGFLFARHDHFQIDRKIEYAILLIAMFIGFWLPMGINISR